ncbi:oligopeptide/dipeptide ABC transporter ATP-binding protein [Streptomyces sp. NPDC048845]|uniref:ABC transporter ATP-binding protein n=1 Tax=Streptomyces sp. NPDC048845 TaxID=3155390 RepID=UPI0034473F23
MSLLELDGVKVHFPVKKGVLFDRTVGHVYAVDGVSLSVEAGQTYGLVGESGCGKTTLGRAILRLVDITEGDVVLDGTNLAELPGEEMRGMRRRLQMVFQDPLGSLDPRQNIESILSEGMAAHGIGADREERRTRIREILAKVGLPTGALSRYPHEFSGGQRQRIGIARALVLEPDVIICDEPVSALDVSIQAQVINLLEELQEQMGLTYVVIAHDLAVVRHISDVIGVMYLGGLVEEGPSDTLYAEPLHPYTKALMSAVPIPDPEVEDTRERILLTGDLPSPSKPPTGCRFHTRCPWKQDTLCATERPELKDAGNGHKVACHYAAEIAAGTVRQTVPGAVRPPEAETAPAEVPAPAKPADDGRTADPGGRAGRAAEPGKTAEPGGTARTGGTGGESAESAETAQGGGTAGTGTTPEAGGTPEAGDAVQAGESPDAGDAVQADEAADADEATDAGEAPKTGEAAETVEAAEAAESAVTKD